MPWTSEVFATADHIPQLPESKRWILRYDDQLPGIGKWSKLVIEDDYAFSYSIRPLAKGVNPAEVAVPKVPDSVKTKSSLNPAPAKKASKKAPKEAAKKELPVAESRPKGWKCVSEKASVEYSTTTKFAKFPDTLLTTQASPFAFHTDSEKAPWLIVDLKKSVPVSGLLIQNREDSLFKRVNNLHVWVSDDKASWKQVFETKGAKKRMAGETRCAHNGSLRQSGNAEWR